MSVDAEGTSGHRLGVVDRRTPGADGADLRARLTVGDHRNQVLPDAQDLFARRRQSLPPDAHVARAIGVDDETGTAGDQGAQYLVVDLEATRSRCDLEAAVEGGQEQGALLAAHRRASIGAEHPSPSRRVLRAHVQCESDLSGVEPGHGHLTPVLVGHRPLVDGDAEEAVAHRRPPREPGGGLVVDGVVAATIGGADEVAGVEGRVDRIGVAFTRWRPATPAEQPATTRATETMVTGTARSSSPPPGHLGTRRRTVRTTVVTAAVLIRSVAVAKRTGGRTAVPGAEGLRRCGRSWPRRGPWLRERRPCDRTGNGSGSPFSRRAHPDTRERRGRRRWPSGRYRASRRSGLDGGNLGCLGHGTPFFRSIVSAVA